MVHTCCLGLRSYRLGHTGWPRQLVQELPGTPLLSCKHSHTSNLVPTV